MKGTTSRVKSVHLLPMASQHHADNPNTRGQEAAKRAESGILTVDQHTLLNLRKTTNPNARLSSDISPRVPPPGKINSTRDLFSFLKNWQKREEMPTLYLDTAHSKRLQCAPRDSSWTVPPLRVSYNRTRQCTRYTLDGKRKTSKKLRRPVKVLCTIYSVLFTMFVFVILNPNPSLVEFPDIFDKLALTSDICSIPLESDKKTLLRNSQFFKHQQTWNRYVKEP